MWHHGANSDFEEVPSLQYVWYPHFIGTGVLENAGSPAIITFPPLLWVRFFSSSVNSLLIITERQSPALVHAFCLVCVGFSALPRRSSSTRLLICIMSLSMVVNWTQRQLVSMKAPVFFWQNQERKSSLEKAAHCREANGAELLPRSLAAIDQRFSCSETPTPTHISPLPCPKINTNARKWSQRSTSLLRIYFHPRYFDVNGCLPRFSAVCRDCYAAHLSIPVCWYQYQLLFSVIGFPQRLSSLQPIPSQEMYCRMKLRGIKWLINCRDKSINNAAIGDTGTVSSSSKQLLGESPA